MSDKTVIKEAEFSRSFDRTTRDYWVAIEQVHGGFNVKCTYGPPEHARAINANTGPLHIDRAVSMYDRIVRERLREGYLKLKESTTDAI
jgi:hypothetical protein